MTAPTPPSHLKPIPHDRSTLFGSPIGAIRRRTSASVGRGAPNRLKRLVNFAFDARFSQAHPDGAESYELGVSAPTAKPPSLVVMPMQLRQHIDVPVVPRPSGHEERTHVTQVLSSERTCLRTTGTSLAQSQGSRE
jgi:hypothetical protein